LPSADRFLGDFVRLKADPANGCLSDFIKAPPECIRVPVGRSFFQDIALELLQRWWIPTSDASIQSSSGEGGRAVRSEKFLVFYCTDPPLGFKGEIAVGPVRSVHRKGTELSSIGLLKSLDGKCTWPESRSGCDSDHHDDVIEFMWDDIADTGGTMLEEKSSLPHGLQVTVTSGGIVTEHHDASTIEVSGVTQAISQEAPKTLAAESVPRQTAVGAGGDGLWSCIGCGSTSTGLVLHVCGCRACAAQCFWAFGEGKPRPGVLDGGCGLARCAKNYNAMKSSEAEFTKRGMVLLLPDAGRGKSKWEAAGHVWAPKGEEQETFPLLECECEMLDRVQQKCEIPAAAIELVSLEIQDERRQSRGKRMRKISH
jgi:hypothetical protein